MGSSYSAEVFFLILVLSMRVPSTTCHRLVQSFYDGTCPNAEKVVEKVVAQAVKDDPRNAASLLRLFFHDCFATGCDGSVLLDNTTSIYSEKFARANNNTLRGFGIVDDIKKAVEEECSETVSCADILALAARDSVVQTGGPYYEVLLGRRDSTTANFSAANAFLPSPKSNVSVLYNNFAAVGLSTVDMVTLSGAHTIGKAHCSSVVTRLFNQSSSGKPDPVIPSGLLSKLQEQCPNTGSNVTKATIVLDDVTPYVFDNQYYKNLIGREGILYSDEVMSVSPQGSSADLVNLYATDEKAFFAAFIKSITKMGNISPLTGAQGEIRKNCHKVND